MNNNILDKISKLPLELTYEIRNYIPTNIMIWLSRSVYYKNHSIIKYLFKNKSIGYNGYIRNIIRNDYNILFENIIKENNTKWFLYKKYKLNINSI